MSYGPFSTEAEARQLPEVQGVYRKFGADPGQGRMAPHVMNMLTAACAAADVELGAFDKRVLQWLSGWEPETAAVVAALVIRSHAAGVARGPSAALADQMAALADWIEQRLDDENYDRLAVAESGVSQLRELAAFVRGGAS